MPQFPSSSSVLATSTVALAVKTVLMPQFPSSSSVLATAAYEATAASDTCARVRERFTDDDRDGLASA